MAVSYFDNRNKQRDRILAVDLGSRTTKAVNVQRRGDSFVLCSYALMDAPIFEKTVSADVLGEHLKAITDALHAKSKSVAMTVGVSDSLLRHAELPRMPVEDMRNVLRLNSRNYLQQDLANYVYDCHILNAAPGKADPKAVTSQPKLKILVAGAKRPFVEELVAAARNAGLVAEHIVPGLVGPTNVFERSMPEIFSNEVVVVLDLGFKNSSICILDKGELALCRVVAIGGDKLTNGVAEALKISYAEAEGIKVGMPTEIATDLDTLVAPLGRELRASIDFYEHQHDRTVSQVFVTGGSSSSDMIVERLQAELMLECKTINPVNFMQLDLSSQQAAEIEQVAPQLTVALGAALAAL